jgi:two-component system response regulator HydG
VTAAPRILVVDDEGSLLLTLAANLELEGFEVVGAESAADALEILRTGGPIEMVLSDIRMPGMNGVELFREIRRLCPDIPVVLMTAFAVEDLVRAGIHEGAFAVLSKPFRMEDAVETLNAALRRSAVVLLDTDPGEAERLLEAFRAIGVRIEHADDDRAAVVLAEQGNVDVIVIEANERAPATVLEIRRVRRRMLCIAVCGAGQSIPHALAAARPFACLKRPIHSGDLVEAVARARGSRAVRGDR